MEKTLDKALVQQKDKSTNVRINGTGLTTLFHRGVELLWNVNPDLFKSFLTEVAFHPKLLKERPLYREWKNKSESYFVPVKSIDRLVKVYKWKSLENSNEIERPVVLLVHGWGGRGLQMNSFIQPLLDKGYDVVTFDAPAHGESTGFSTNFFEMVESVKTIIEYHQNIDGIVAHSMGCGGVIANLPQFNFIERVVLIAPHFDMEHEIKKWAMQTGMSEKMFSELIHHLENKYQKNLSNFNPKNLAKEIESNVLLIHDMDDKPCSYKNSVKLKEKIPNVELMLTSKFGHFRIIKEKSIVDKTVKFFK